MEVGQIIIKHHVACGEVEVREEEEAQGLIVPKEGRWRRVCSTLNLEMIRMLSRQPGSTKMVLFHFNLRLDGWTAGDVI